MARPKKNADEKLSEPFRARMSLATKANLVRKSQAAGLSEGEFLRRFIDGVALPPARSGVDPALIAALNNYVLSAKQLHNNVNQLAAAMHMDRDFTKYWREIGAELELDLKAGRRTLNALLEGMG